METFIVYGLYLFGLAVIFELIRKSRFLLKMTLLLLVLGLAVSAFYGHMGVQDAVARNNQEVTEISPELLEDWESSSPKEKKFDPDETKYEDMYNDVY